jgi:TolB protein
VSPAQGGQQRRLTDGSDGFADWSPDGRWIAFNRLGEDGLNQVWRVPASGGQPERLTTTPGRRPRWSPDGRQVYFLGRGSGANNVWVLSMATRTERPVTAFSGRRGVLDSRGLAVDARNLYFTWQESRGDIWVADIGPPPKR